MNDNAKKQILHRIARIGKIPEVKVQGLENFFKPDEMPALEPTPLGRHRLIQAFRNKYGESFRNRRGVSGAIKDFDEQVNLIKKTLELGVK